MDGVLRLLTIFMMVLSMSRMRRDRDGVGVCTDNFIAHTIACITRELTLVNPRNKNNFLV